MIRLQACQILEDFKIDNPPENSWDKKLGVSWFREERLVKEAILELLNPILDRFGYNIFGNRWSGLIVFGLTYDHLLSRESIENIQNILIAWYNSDHSITTLVIPGKMWAIDYDGTYYRVLEVISKSMVSYYKNSLLSKINDFPELRDECLIRISDMTRRRRQYYLVISLGKNIPGRYTGGSNDAQIQKSRRQKMRRREKRKMEGH